MVKFYKTVIFLFVVAFFFNSAKAANTVVTPAPAISNMCVGGSFSTVGTIVIAETNITDFSAGGSLTYILSAPTNFEFNPSVTPTVTTNSGSGITNIVVTAPTTTTLTFTFDLSAASMSGGPLDSLKIIGLQVKAVTAAATGDIKKTGGSAFMQGNSPADNQSHCALTSGAAPIITTQPSNKSVCTGGANVAIFNVVASGSGLTYSWYRDNNDNSDGAGFDEIATTVSAFYGGYNTANLTSGTVSINQNGFIYKVAVTNACGITTTSNTAVLSTADPAAVTTQPTNQSICTGANTAFSVAGNNTSIYQWQENSGSGFADISNGGVYSGATSATLTITGATVAMNGRTYRCNLSNSICNALANSNSATLSVSNAAAVTADPTNKSACTGSNVTFTVTGSNATSFQWQENSGSGFANISNGAPYGGATTATLTLTGVTTTLNGRSYRCILSNSICTTQATSNSATLSVANAAQITTDPSNATSCTGSASFSVVASNATVYQWQVNTGSGFGNISNGGVYSGAATANLVLNGVTAGMNGYTYKCVVSNAICSTADNSNTVTLSVNSTPVITSQPANSVTCVGNSPTFTVAASGSSLSYSWERDRNDGNGFGTPPTPAYSGLTSATFTINNISAAQSGYLIRCIVSNSCGSVTSNTATVTAFNSGGSLDFFGLETSYCRNGLVDTLQGFPAGGVFSGSGMGATNSTTGKAAFNPSSAGPGTKTISYTYGCAVTKNTTVKDTLNIAFTSPANASPTYTNADPAVDLVVETVPPSGALAGIYSGTGVAGSQFKPVDAGIGTFPVTFTYTNPNGCISKAVKPIQVTSPGLGIPALLKGSPYCQGANTPVKLNIDSVQGGMPYFLSPSYYNSIVNLYSLYCSFYGGIYCDYYNAYASNGKIYEYDYNGKGITDNQDGTFTFNPDSAGSYTIQYRYKNVYNGQITVYAQQTVTVRAKTNLSLDGLLPAVCNVNSPFDMTPAPGVVTGAPGTLVSIISPVSTPAGVLSGPSNNIFNPSVANSGNYTVRYHYVSANGCASDFDKTITVFSKPAVPSLDVSNPVFGVQNEQFCYGTLRKRLKMPTAALTSYNWYSSPALTPISLVETSPILDPNPAENQPGTYHYYVTKTVSGCTSDPLDVKFIINDKAKVDPGLEQTICEGNTVTLAGVSKKEVSGAALGGTWSSPIPGSFNSATNLSAVYTPSAAEIAQKVAVLTLTTDDPDGSGPCPTESKDVRININPGASVYAGGDKTYCSNQAITLSATPSGSASTVTWSGGNPDSIVSKNLATTLYKPTNAEKSGGIIVFTATTNDPDGPLGPCLAGTDNVNITINQEAKVYAGPDHSICKSDPSVDLTGAVASAGTHSATWSGGTNNFGAYNSTSLSDLKTTYTLSASEQPLDGPNKNVFKLALTTDDPDNTGPCLAVSDTVQITVNALPKIGPVIVPKTAFCNSEVLFQIITSLSSNGKKSEVYSDLPNTNVGISGQNFVPQTANPGPHTIRYTVTDDNLCVNFRDTSIYVYKMPDPKMKISHYCATDSTIFSAKSSGFPVNTNDHDNISQINSFDWKFGDFNNSLKDTSTKDSISYVYPKTLNLSAIQSYLVKLKVGTNKGCFAEIDSSITIGNIPDANFKWSNICPADPVTKFVDLSDFPSLEVSSYKWSFDDGSAIATGPGMIGSSPNLTSNLALKNPNHKMANSTGAYDVEFIISTVRGCSDTMNHAVYILDEYKPKPSDPYVKTFDVNNGFWAVDGLNPSWQWGAANKTDISTGTRNVWVTNTTGVYNEGEKSYINGPCLDFTELERPMISMKIWSATEEKFAGTVLQYSTDGGNTWSLVGSDQTGVNWYNTYGIFGNPGSQQLNQFGWSGFYDGWKVAKAGMNNLAGSATVRIRLAFGSGDGDHNTRDGFAIDSIWVGERDKLLLVENFTNTSFAGVVSHDKKLDSIIAVNKKDVVSIHYHTGFPAPDPINLNNQADPSSRVLLYGVPPVPYYVFDGNISNGIIVSNTDKTKFMRDIDKRSLDRAKFAIDLNTLVNSDSVKASARITAREAMANDVVVQVAVVERAVTAFTGSNGQSNFEWVLSRMLPNAGGTYFDADFSKDDFVDVNVGWDYFPTEVFDPNQLGVIVFVQDVATKEIYQTAYQFQSVGTVTTSLKNEKLMARKVDVYPNPTRDIANFIFENATESEMSYTVANELGQVVQQGIVESGSNRFNIKTDNLPEGMYVVRVGSEEEGYVFKKIVVSR